MTILIALFIIGWVAAAVLAYRREASLSNL